MNGARWGSGEFAAWPGECKVEFCSQILARGAEVFGRAWDPAARRRCIEHAMCQQASIADLRRAAGQRGR
jgi:hypothetical protein